MSTAAERITKLIEGLNTVKTDLASHVSGCTENGKHIRADLRDLKADTSIIKTGFVKLETTVASMVAVETNTKIRDKHLLSGVAVAVAIISCVVTVITLLSRGQ